MPPKKKKKSIAGQKTIAAAFSAPSTSAPLPDSDQPPESTSTYMNISANYSHIITYHH